MSDNMEFNLCLVTIKLVTFKDGTEKYKYIFLNKVGKAYIGWNEDLKYEEECINSNTFDEARARAWEVDQDVFNDKLTYKVLIL